MLKMSDKVIDCLPNLRELTAFPTRSHGKVNIPEQIGVKYREFGVQLLEDSTGARVSNMVDKHRGDPQRINTEILQEWLQNKHGERPVSWRTLVEVLRDIKLGELARDIEEACLLGKITIKSSGQRNWSLNLWQNRRKLFMAAVLVCFIVILGLIGALTGNTMMQPSIVPEYGKAVMDVGQSIENLATGVAMSTTTQSSILEYAKVLNATYQMQPVTDPSHWLPVMMPFINLTLMESNKPERTMRASIESQLHDRYQLTLDEVVDSVKKGSKILMEGRPGVGKTTMLRHIAKEWAEGKLLQSFQFVILIRLGHIPSSRISNLESMLEYHSHDYPDTASVARELGRTGGEGTCFLLDALDEYSPQIPTHSDYIYQLIRGDRLPNAALIVTSRPNASYNLQQVFTRKIEVVGFLQHQIQQYINSLPADHATTISKYINRYTNVKRITSLPLHLAMMTYLALHSEKVSLLDLDTETRIYHMFVNLTFRQRYKDVENLDEVHSQAFSALSKAAFDATTRVSNSETRLTLHHLDPKLRAKVESFSILTINKQHEGDKVSEVFTFSHYTFQEFFAAYYLTTLPHEEQMQALKLYQWSSQLMWKFFFGLLRAHSSKNITKLFQNFAHTQEAFRGGPPIILLMCAYELKQAAIADVLVQAFNHSISSSYDPSVCATIGYALSLNSHLFKRITIFTYDDIPSEESWEACFVSMFAELPKSNGVVQVTLDYLVISNRTISALAQCVQYLPSLQQLEMLNIHVWASNIMSRKVFDPNYELEPLNYTETVKFAKELERLRHLRLLRVGIISYAGRREIVKFVATVLKNLTALQYLEYCESDTLQTMQGLKEYHTLAESLKCLTSLQTLKVLWLPLWSLHAAAVLENIKYLTSLQALELRYFAGTGSGRVVAVVAEGLTHLTSLQTLNLAQNRIGFDEVEEQKFVDALAKHHQIMFEIGDRGVAKLAEGIKHLTSLETLNLAWNGIGYDGIVALTGGITSLTSLETLDLSHNKIGDRSAAKLAEGIKHLTSLETLNLAWNGIGYDGIVALTGGIKSLTLLKTLDLSHNKIGGGSAAKLVEGIKHLTSLEALNLAWNRIRYDGVVALTGGLESLTSLKTLDLSMSGMGDMSAAKLAEGIKHLPLLEILSLAGNEIGYDGVEALIGGVKNLTSLKTLDLDHNKIEGRDVAKLVEGIKHLTSLEIHGLRMKRF